MIILGKRYDLFNIDTFEYLKECGANFDANNNYALRLSAENGYLDIVKYLIEHDKRVDYLDEIVMPSHRANVQAKCDHALILSAEKGHWDVVKYLIECGAAVSKGRLVSERAGSTLCESWAASSGYAADIHTRDDFALRWSAKNGHLDIVEYLMENGANIHADNDYALRLSAENGYLDIVKYLIEKGANIRASDDCALKRSAELGHLDVVKYLIEKGANVRASDDCALRWSSCRGARLIYAT